MPKALAFRQIPDFRSIRSGKVWRKPELLRLLMELYYRGRNTPTSVEYKTGRGTGVQQLNPGQCLIGVPSLADALGEPTATVRKRLKRLETWGYIVLSPQKHFTICTLADWIPSKSEQAKRKKRNRPKCGASPDTPSDYTPPETSGEQANATNGSYQGTGKEQARNTYNREIGLQGHTVLGDSAGEEPELSLSPGTNLPELSPDQHALAKTIHAELKDVVARNPFDRYWWELSTRLSLDSLECEVAAALVEDIVASNGNIRSPETYFKKNFDPNVRAAREAATGVNHG